MIVQSFVAKKVYGYLDFNIKFNKDISFLVGGNGAGKTTALKLMNALVTPNFKDLLQIPFESISLVVEDNREISEISAAFLNKHIALRISSVEDELQLPLYLGSEFEFSKHTSDKSEEFFDSVGRKYVDHEVVQRISKIASPIFLGLDRRHENFDGGSTDYYFEREMRLRAGAGKTIGSKRLIRGSLGISLMETELLVQNAYRRLREVEDRQSNKLRDSILLSTFKYSVFSKTETEPLNWKENQVLLKRQNEIKEALSKIGVRDSRLGSELDDFFVRITKLYEGMASKDGGNTIEWLLNKVQIDRMSRIIEIIDEHRSKIDEIFRPINEFILIINNFFSDSNKKISLNTVGQLVVTRPDGKEETIEGLSSGERQILVIFAHAFFTGSRGQQNVFIIDEPELSLHLAWQEKFAETILAINSGTQFILATHSPEIIGVNKKKTVGCR